MILAVHSYPGANDAVKRHYPYWKNAGCIGMVGIGTTDGGCEWPATMATVEIGDGHYINGRSLPERLLDTLRWFVNHTDIGHLAVIEYDTLIFKPLPRPKHIGCALTGGAIHGSKSTWFAHNPWLMSRFAAFALIRHMQDILRKGHCQAGTPEASPDIFFAYACELSGLSVDKEAFTAFSRNSLDVPGDLELARDAYHGGVSVIHGVKTQQELEFITT